MFTSLISAAALAVTSMFHAGPYTLSTHVVHTHAHRIAYERVTVNPDVISCRGQATDVWVYASSDDGGEEAEPATWSVKHHDWTAKLEFTVRDRGSSWVIVGINGDCPDGSSFAYDGVHPTFTVR